MKIGIFGGCFNPPHNMHKEIARNLIEQKYLDKVIYVPTGNCYKKKELITAEDRYQMLKIMTHDDPNLLVDNVEMKKDLIYTYQTLDYFKEKFKEDEIYFICGSDNLKEITTWKNYQYILDHYQLLIIKRENNDIISKFENVIEVNIPSSKISSTMIRKRIKNNQVEKYLDSKVMDYIKMRGLYNINKLD